MSTDDTDITRLICVPFESFCTRITEHAEFCSVVMVALQEMLGMPELCRALESTTKKPRKAEIEDAEEMAKIAESEVQTGFATLFNSAAIYIWGALESAIRDTAVNWLIHIPKSRQCDRIRRLKISFYQYEQLNDLDDKMRYLVNALENDLSSPLQPGIGRFESLLSVLGLGGAVDDDLRKDILEFVSVRNVLVHRHGIADDRFVKLCPWYDVSVGDRVSVTSDAFWNKYRPAVCKYAAIVLRRIDAEAGNSTASD